MMLLKTLIVLNLVFCLVGQTEANDSEKRRDGKEQRIRGKEKKEYFTFTSSNDINPRKQRKTSEKQYDRKLKERKTIAKPYVFEEPEKEENEKERRFIIKYKKQKINTQGSTKVSSRRNIDLLETAKVLSLDQLNADVVLLKSEAELVQLQNDANVAYVEEGKY